MNDYPDLAADAFGDGEPSFRLARPRQRMTDPDMDITPMIDITFLLLIFFIVASKMDASDQVKLPPARNGSTVTLQNSVVLSVIPRGTDRVDIFRGPAIDPLTRITSDDPVVQNEQIVDYIEEAISGDSPKEFVLIRAQRDVPYRHVARIMTAAGHVGGISIYVAVMEESP